MHNNITFVNQNNNVFYLLIFYSGYYPTEVCTTTFLFSVTKVMEKYLVPDYANVQEFLAHLGKRLGKLKKGKLFVQRNNELRKSGLCCSEADNTKPRHFSQQVLK